MFWEKTQLTYGILLPPIAKNSQEFSEEEAKIRFRSE